MSLTPNPSRRLGFPLPPSPAPFLTPRPEKRPPDLRWADGSSIANRHETDREVNIQVVLRCRPLSDEEQKNNVQSVISCHDQKREVTVLQSLLNRQADKSHKTFTFDKVFGPKVRQRPIYDHAIAPFVTDVLEGYNCTVFAYGQTGTGKTYTMEGGIKSKGGDLSTDAGVIPRAVRHIFDTLEARKADYSMRVTFLELYSEEITDLLVPEDNARSLEDRHRRSISLMEDGKGGAVIRGLHEEVVYSANEIYGLLERGSAKRHTADTHLNKQSSRSHSIFSITVHVKEAVLGSQELIKCGRLNLVDLAGSENISRSGVREGRAREAGEVNKSLLTLGRVITALVEHSGHIPYRDSKLTRLLRESLGGKAKTCIIATVSPSIHCLEETLSTLDYAHRAKTIKNKPEANQKLLKSVLLKDLYLEIERMKQDVRAAREKNGVYVPHERFAQDEEERKAMNEKIEQLQFELDLMRKEADRVKELYNAELDRNLDLEKEIKDCKISLENSKRVYLDLHEVHVRTNLTLKEKEFIISNMLQSEHAIIERAKELHSNLETAVEDRSVLLAKIERQTKTGKQNQRLMLTFSYQLDQSLDNLHKTVVGSVCQQHQLLRSMEEHVNSFIASKCEAAKTLELRIGRIKDVYSSGILGMKELASSLQKRAFLDLEDMGFTIFAQAMAVENFLVAAVSEAELVLNDIQQSLLEQKELLVFSVQQQEAGLQRSLVSTQIISKTTIDFFNDLQSWAANLITLLEENQIERSCQVAAFEKTFKELSAKEERLAMEKIAGVLRNLTDTKTKLVSEAIWNMNDMSLEAKKRFQQDISHMQNVSYDAEKEWIAYIQKVESQFQEDECSTSETHSKMGRALHYGLEKVGQSVQHWENAQLVIDHLNKDHATEIKASIEKRNQESNNILKGFLSVSSHTDEEFNRGTCDLLTTVNSSVLLDRKVKKELDTMTAMSSDHLKTLQGSHTERTEDLRSQADKCLVEEYLVDCSTGTTPRKQVINVPSLASIEALRTPSFTDLGSENNRLRGQVEGKQQYLLTETPRSPLTPVN